MIKKIIACLTICFIITGIISPVFSDASALPQPNWSDPGISEIINISDLTGWMLNGGHYDVSTYTDAESFMNDYYTARTKTRLEGSDYQVISSFGLEQTYYAVGDSAYAHPLDINRVISSSFRDHSGYGRRLTNEVNDALLSTGNLYDTKIPLLSEIEFANFVGYNHDALNLYASQFLTSDSPDPNPDPNYANYLDTINGSGFYFKNYPSQVGGQGYFQNATYYPFESYSFFSTTISGNNVLDPIGESYLSYNFYQSNLITININSISNNNYTYSVSASSLYPAVRNDWNFAPWAYFQFRYDTNTWGAATDGGRDSSVTVNSSYTGSLSNVLNHIAARFRNVTIYVDNELWSIAGSLPDPMIPEFPDAVGGEELPTTTWPIFRPRAPYYTNVPGMLQAIEDAIQGDGDLDIDDLKPYLTDANGDPVQDPEFDPEPVPIPNPDPVNPDVVPGLPEIPIIPVNMPGYNGVSVLAEIINFTNQSLPTSLIVTFWGIVFGIVILGLIKILHK